jgi:hypothetical protein
MSFSSIDFEIYSWLCDISSLTQLYCPRRVYPLISLPKLKQFKLVRLYGSMADNEALKIRNYISFSEDDLVTYEIEKFKIDQNNDKFYYEKLWTEKNITRNCKYLIEVCNIIGGVNDSAHRV